MTKICNKCSESKPLSEFHKHRRQKDGLNPTCKRCVRQYQQKNREHIAIRRREYYQANREKEIRRDVLYNRANRDKINKRRRELYDDNERRKRHERYVNNKAHEKSVRDAYLLTPEGQSSAARSRANRRAKMLGNGGMLTVSINDLAERQNNRCYLCGLKFTKVKRKPTLEHIIPLSRGGPNSDENVAAACKSCNSSKSTKPPEQMARELGRLLI